MSQKSKNKLHVKTNVMDAYFHLNIPLLTLIVTLIAVLGFFALIPSVRIICLVVIGIIVLAGIVSLFGGFYAVAEEEEDRDARKEAQVNLKKDGRETSSSSISLEKVEYGPPIKKLLSPAQIKAMEEKKQTEEQHQQEEQAEPVQVQTQGDKLDMGNMLKQLSQLSFDDPEEEPDEGIGDFL